jgi:hypothetical protein
MQAIRNKAAREHDGERFFPNLIFYYLQIPYITLLKHILPERLIMNSSLSLMIGTGGRRL